MHFDRKIFFEQYRRYFAAPNQMQITGLERLLWGYETYYGWWDFIPQIANSLAQVKHETAHSFLPVVEGYYLGNPKAPGYYTGNTARVERFQRSLRYYPHIGMGDIQLTWAENFAEQDGYIRKFFPEIVTDFERRTKEKFDLISHPRQALDPKISFAVMTIGMHKGTFREGQTLDRYLNRQIIDHFNARNIVNGDRNYRNKQGEKIGDVIARDAVRFTKILEASLIPEKLVLQQDEIDRFADGIGSTSTANNGDPAGSLVDSQSSTLKTVESPEPGADVPQLADAAGAGDNAVISQTVRENIQTEDGSRSAESTVITPAGDAPNVEPSHFFSIEDWKPWAKRWASRIWTGVTTLSLPTTGAFSFAAFQDSSNWYVYAIVGGVVLFLIVGLAIVATLVVAGIWLWQNRGIPAIKQTQMEILANPELKNVGLSFVKK